MGLRIVGMCNFRGGLGVGVEIIRRSFKWGAIGLRHLKLKFHNFTTTTITITTPTERRRIFADI
jgi:hypothetical protein